MTGFVLNHVGSLKARLGSGVTILTDPDDAVFHEHAKRWSDIDRMTPAAIVLPVSEEQILKTVQWAVEFKVPFVTKSGGHSTWSTIDRHGIVIDLTRYAGIDVDVEKKQATLKGSILSKEVSVALADARLFTALGNGNPVGAIPYFLGGGASIVTSAIGYGSDQIVSARLVDARGRMIEVTEEKEPDLLWALRGAGQFFGLVTELVVKAYPTSILGNDQGTIWTGAFVFPLSRAKEVTSVMKTLMDDGSKATAGLVMIMAPPPKHQPALVVAARYTGTAEDAKVAYTPLHDLQPLVATGQPVPIQNASDGRDAFNAKGDFKRFATVGLHHFDEAAFLQVIQIWKDMIQECPDAINTSFNFQWDARFAPTPPFDSANSLHDIRYWQNNFVWYKNDASGAKVDEYNEQAIRLMRGTDQSKYVDFQNATRTGPVALRFRGDGKVERLRAMKRKWDPEGVFCKQLLDDEHAEQAALYD
ncbi:hypothetical protein DE146DRAFT_623490 [Phaeosphaeria sp. MPI-PUGE-AT-0046c]|nr:hypothetical protein DE146DRAFT_623490 [Phaeosphaeria sp. MPI-PUGE-AT-0046c]